MVPLLHQLGACPFLAVGMPTNERALDPESLAQALGPQARPVANIDEALKVIDASQGTVLICGSLYLLGEFFERRPALLGYDTVGLTL